MRILHIGKYYSPFEGGIENFLAALLSFPEGNSHYVLAHHHEAGRRTVEEKVGSITVLRSFTLCRLLFAPIAPFYYRHLKLTLRSFQPDVMHVHMPNLSAFWLLLLGKELSIPIVVHWHADVVPSAKNLFLSIAYFFYEKLEKILLARAKVIIATSAPYLEISKPLRKWQQKCRVIPLGLDTESPAGTGNAASNWQKTDTFKVLCIGRLTYYKGHEFLIKTMEKIQVAELIIVGAGKLFSKYQSYLKSHNLQNKIRLFGHADTDELHNLLASCDCLCLPSIERTEAFGLVLLEAMQFAKPCITTSVAGSGMSWVVQHNITGLVVPPKDPAALAKALTLLQRDPALAARLGVAGKQRVQDHFSLYRVSKEISAVYNSVHKN